MAQLLGFFAIFVSSPFARAWPANDDITSAVSTDKHHGLFIRASIWNTGKDWSATAAIPGTPAGRPAGVGHCAFADRTSRQSIGARRREKTPEAARADGGGAHRRERRGRSVAADGGHATRGAGHAGVTHAGLHDVTRGGTPCATACGPRRRTALSWRCSGASIHPP